jgi:hypothetical protein
LAFLIGTAVGAFNTRAAESLPSFLFWLLVPGFFLLLPIQVVTGGAHGSFMDVIIWSVPPVNGAAYALLTFLFVGIKRKIFTQSGKAR